MRDEGELTVGELVARLDEAQPKVSNHLACLRWCGFVATRREHRAVYNRTADERVIAMLDLAQRCSPRRGARRRLLPDRGALTATSRSRKRLR